MGATANRSYPYPADSDPVRPYEDIQDLAEAVDTDVTALGSYQAYTLTMNNLTLGAGGTANGWYTKLPGGLIHGGFYVVFGTSPAIGTTSDISLPEAAWMPGVGIGLQMCIGSWIMRDQAPTLYHYAGSLGIWNASSPGSVTLSGAWDGTAPRSRATNGTPFTVAATDYLTGTFSYRAAS